MGGGLFKDLVDFLRGLFLRGRIRVLIYANSYSSLMRQYRGGFKKLGSRLTHACPLVWTKLKRNYRLRVSKMQRFIFIKNSIWILWHAMCRGIFQFWAGDSGIANKTMWYVTAGNNRFHCCRSPSGSEPHRKEERGGQGDQSLVSTRRHLK